MSLCQHSNLLLTRRSCFGCCMAGCGLCGLIGPWAVTEDLAIRYFWKEHYLNMNKENTVAQPLTYEDGYRKGVQDATEPVTQAEYHAFQQYEGDTPASISGAILSVRRKALLTRKVTKWVRIYYNEANTPQLFPGSFFFYDTEHDALNTENIMGFKYLIFAKPIEIELPL